MLVALGEFSLLGVRTTAGFLRDVVASEPFACAELSTQFVPQFLSHWLVRQASAAGEGSEDLNAALIAAALTGKSPVNARRIAATDADGGQPASTPQRSPWAELGAFELWRKE
jgi:acetyl/propionyl-CoA carboxylase alpha subunit